MHYRHKLSTRRSSHTKLYCPVSSLIINLTAHTSVISLLYLHIYGYHKTDSVFPRELFTTDESHSRFILNKNILLLIISLS